LRVGSGERLEVELALAEGAYRLRGPQLPYTVDFQVQPHASLWRLDWPLPGPPDPLWKQVLRAGSQLLVLSNEHNDEIVVRVERAAQRSDALTAARAASLALFRELFPGEVLSPRQLMNVSMVTFLVTEIESASVIYRSLGDVQAFGVIHEHFRLLEDEIRRQGGALVKTVGEGLLAAFSEARAAVSAALSLAQTLKKHETTRDLRLKIGVHRGAVMAATLNDHLDYFGTAVNTAWQLVRHAHGNEVLLTEPVAGDPQVAALLCQRGIEGEVVERGPLAVLRCTHR
jgi:class 3 adenylate cyclase